MARALAALLLAATHASASDSYAVIAIAEPERPSHELSELTHQLRAACRERAGEVLDAAETRARLTGQGGGATLANLERAYAGAEITFHNGEFEVSARTLRSIVEELEKQPGGEDAHAQWVRAIVRLAYTEKVLKRADASARALDRLLALEPEYAPDPYTYPPSLAREVEAARRRIAAAGTARLAITSTGTSVAAFVNAKPVGMTPVTVTLPPGEYRVSGALGALRVPGAVTRLEREAGSVELDVSLAESVRLGDGPAIALAGERTPPLVQIGRWLGVTRLVATSIVAEGGGRFLDGAVYDVERASPLRRGRVRIASGSVEPASVGALAGFALTGKGSAAVTAVPPSIDLSAGAAASPILAAQPAVSKRTWTRPAAYTAGAVALGLAGIAVWQGLEARRSYDAAAAGLGPDGAVVAGGRAAYDRAIAAGDGARRNAYIGAIGVAAFAGAAAVLGYLSTDSRGAPAVRF